MLECFAQPSDHSAVKQDLDHRCQDCIDSLTEKSANKSSGHELLSPRQAACGGNTAQDRSRWCSYSAGTDYHDDGPTTGNTVEYFWTLQNVTLAPDGVPRQVLTVNGTMPGPAIHAQWGDIVVIHVTNGFSNNGSAIHFHGIRQNWTNPYDGVPSVTQCPIGPGQTLTYRWKCTQYGTSWYHSHLLLQAWDGVFGPIVIDGPATANYDQDLGPLFLQDWDHSTAQSLYSSADTNGPPTMDTGLINGQNVYQGGGSRYQINIQSGVTYRLRLINPSIDSFMDFSIDNHTLQVIANDLVPIVPYTTQIIGLAPGQRYDVIFTANQQSIASDFWLRAVPDKFCSVNNNTDDIRAIVHYDGSTGTPTTNPWTTDDSFTNCRDPPSASLVPFVRRDAAAADVTESREVTVGLAPGTNIFKWYLNNITFLSQWEDPTSLQILRGNRNFTAQQAVIQLPTAGEWMYLIIEQNNTQPHPIHLHGHDFYILASGTGRFTSNTPTNLQNPPRRDVAQLPAAGYLLIAFPVDNPGAWLLHCHIGWHTSEGFALQFIEQIDQIAGLYNSAELQGTCNSWNTFTAAGAGRGQDDSGV